MAIFAKKPDGDEETNFKVESSGSKPGGVSAVLIPIVLVQPRVSEKSGHLAGINKYVFKITNSANKVEVKKAIEAVYKVRVVKVNIVTNKGKFRTYGRSSGMTSPFKKAVVTLKQGDKIEGLTETI